jgi:PhnB protein
LFLYGRAEEALEFYKDVFGGTYQAMRASDSPMGANVPPEAAGRVMHARFTADDATFMLSDGMQTKAVDSDAGNISLSLEFEDASRGERIFEGLPPAET